MASQGVGEGGSDQTVGVAGAGGDGGPTTPSCTDQDADGYGVGEGCPTPDCDDLDPLINPGMLELADDSKDNDCAGGDVSAKTGPGYYVNGSDVNCSDAPNAPGSKAAPYCTVEIAVLRAYQATSQGDKVGRSIFVAQGTYPNTVGTPRSLRLYGGYDSSDWSNVNSQASVVVQGFHVQGGKKPGEPIFAVTLNTSGKVELVDNVIVAGEGYQTVAINIQGENKNDSRTSNVWLIRNRIGAGTPTNSSNYGVNNLGTAVLWGNVIDMGLGSGTAQSFGAAVQNYGTMTLTNNVLNGGSYGTNVDSSYGFINATADMLSPSGVGYAFNNVIFGGRGSKNSVGVRNDAELMLVNNVIGDRTPGPLPFAQKPSELAATVTHGFAAATQLKNNDLFQLLYSDEVNPPDAAANRHLLVWSDNQAHYLESPEAVDACNWTGCGAGSGQNLSVVPGFASAVDFHLAGGSALLGKGVAPSDPRIRDLSSLDIDGQLRPVGVRDIGVDQH